MSPSPGRARRAPSAGTVTSAAVLGLLHLGAAFGVYSALAMRPAGPWDDDVLLAVEVASYLAIGLAVPALALTALAVRRRWLRAWWFVLPALLVALAAARLLYVDRTYPAAAGLLLPGRG
ncbi:hypothetical protein ABTX81_35205 [Kitasatospora sp. NPDC097605]|uniref:hypothetical protein n=1 Tax=Kitasatospora sp. NPDC097605 TaxID=3157226 RepID=UPI00332B9213